MKTKILKKLNFIPKGYRIVKNKESIKKTDLQFIQHFFDWKKGYIRFRYDPVNWSEAMSEAEHWGELSKDGKPLGSSLYCIRKI